MGDIVNAMADCTPSGTCTAQTSMTGAAYCYTNGVKMGMSFDLATMSGTLTIKNASKVCMIADVTGDTIVYKDTAGKTIATVVGTTNATTCPDGSTGIMDDTCGGGVPSSSSSKSPDNCATGVCTL
jgi:hypothetical protein